MNPTKMKLQDKYKKEIYATVDRLQRELDRQTQINIINYQIPMVDQNKPIVNIKLGPRNLQALLDTGADTNLMPGAVYEQLRRDNLAPAMSPPRAGHQVRGISGESMDIAGYCRLTFKLDDSGVNCTDNFMVIYPPIGDEPNRLKTIIGYPTMRSNRLIIVPGKGVLRERDLLRQVSNLGGIYPVVAKEDHLLIPGIDTIVSGQILSKAGQDAAEQIGRSFVVSADLDPELGNPRPYFLPFICSCNPSRTVQLRINPLNIITETLIRKNQVIAYGTLTNPLNPDAERLIDSITVLAQLNEENDPSDEIRQDLLNTVQIQLRNPEHRQLLQNLGLNSLVTFCMENPRLDNFSDVHITENQTSGVGVQISQPQRTVFDTNVDILPPTEKPKPNETGEDGEVRPEKLNPQFYDNLETPHEIPNLGSPEHIETPWEEVIKKINCYHDPAKPQLLDIVNKYKEAVSKHKYDLGRYNGGDVEVQVKPGSAPVHSRFRPTPPQLFGPAQKLLNQLEKFEIISRGSSTYSSPARWVIKSKPDMTAEQCRKKGVEPGSKDETCQDIDLRLTLDLRQLNKTLIFENHPLISPKKLIPLITKASFCSVIDLPSAFYQLPLHQNSRKYFGFSANSTHYVLNRLSMGAKNSPQSLMTVLLQVLAGLETNVLVYSDNLILLTEEPDYETHLKLVEEVFKRFTAFGLKLSLEKSHFIITEKLQIFGHKINLVTKQIRPDTSKIDKLRSLPFPVNRSLLKGFIGGVNFFLELLGNIAADLAILNQLLRNPTQPYQPSEIHEEAFQRILIVLTRDNFVLLPDLQKTFYIFVDCGPCYCAGIIAQESAGGALRPVAYYNKTLSETESKYSQVEREALGLISLLRSYQYLLQLGDLVLFTDCRSLSFIKQGSNSNLKLNRYSQFLALFTYKVFFLAARHPISRLVDLMSRPDSSKPRNIRFSEDNLEKIIITPQLFWKYALNKGELNELIEEGIKIYQDGQDLTELQLNEKTRNKEINTLSVLAVTRSQTKRTDTTLEKPSDPHTNPRRPGDTTGKVVKTSGYNKTRDSCTAQPASIQKQNTINPEITIPDWIDNHHHKLLQLAISEDTHWNNVKTRLINEDLEVQQTYRLKDGIIMTKDENPKIVVPDAMAIELIHSVHTNKLYEHTGSRRLKLILQQHFVISNLNRKIAGVLNNCLQCVLQNPLNKPLRTVDKVITGPYPNHTIHLDLLVLDHSSKEQVLQIVDTYSKFVVMIGLEQDCDSNLFLQLLTDNWLVKYGLPRVCLSDNASILTSKMCTNLYLRFNIELIKIHPYLSRANLTERYNRRLRSQLRVLMTYHNVHPNHWKTMITFVNLAVNNCPQHKSQMSPAQKFLGRDTDTLFPKCVTDKIESQNKMWSHAITEQLVRCKQAGNTVLEQTEHKRIGDVVYLKTRNMRVPYQKQFLKFRGPFTIVDETRSGYVIKEYRTPLFPGTGRKEIKLIKVDKDDVKPTSAAHLFPTESFQEFVAAWRGKLSQYHSDDDSSE